MNTSGRSNPPQSGPELGTLESRSEREENKARFHEKSYNAARYPGKPASCNEIQRRLEDDVEAELERTRGAQRKHPGAQPNQVRTISAGSAIQSSRRSIQDAAQRLAWRVKVLPIEEIVDANLRSEERRVGKECRSRW